MSGEFSEETLGRLGELDEPAPEVVVEEPAPTAEVEEAEEEETEEVETEEVEEVEAEEVEEEEPKKVPLDALKDERRKRQELQERLDQLEQRISEPQPQKPKSLEESYREDPKGVMNALTDQIAAAEQEGNVVQAERLRDLKQDLRNTDVVALRKSQEQQIKQQQLNQALLEAVPDYATKHKVLTDFAIEEMGYSMQELAQRTDPATQGVAGIKEIVRINNLYEKFMAKSTVPKKKVKKVTSVEKPSSGGGKKPDNLAKKFKQAKESGNTSDWADALMDLGDD